MSNTQLTSKYSQPNFIVIGAQKCGTTSIYHYLRKHPSIYLPDLKETNFFSDPSLFQKGVENYLANHYKTAQNYGLVGEICPSYLSNLNAAERIYNSLGKIKIIVIFRNPTDRAYSNYMMRVARQQENRSFEKAIDEEINELSKLKTDDRKEYPPGSDYIYNGMYARHVIPYIDLFGIDSILFLSFNKLKEDRFGFMNQIYDFLGCKAIFDETLINSFNISSKPRSKSLEYIIRNKFPLKPILSKMFSQRIKNKILSWNTVPNPNEPMSEICRRRLDDFFSNENLRLKQMLDGIWDLDDF